MAHEPPPKPFKPTKSRPLTAATACSSVQSSSSVKRISAIAILSQQPTNSPASCTTDSPTLFISSASTFACLLTSFFSLCLRFLFSSDRTLLKLQSVLIHAALSHCQLGGCGIFQNPTTTSSSHQARTDFFIKSIQVRHTVHHCVPARVVGVVNRFSCPMMKVLTHNLYSLR